MTQRMKKFVTVALIAGLTLETGFSSTVLARWTFETYTAGATTGRIGPTLTAEEGLSTFLSSATGVHVSTSTQWSNPAGNGSAESFSANGWAAGDYYLFNTSSEGFSGISVSWDQTGSSTGPSSFALLYSTDQGASFTQFATYSVVRATPTGQPNTINYSDGTTGTGWNSSQSAINTSFSYDLSSIAGLNNNPTIYFRLSNLSTGVASTGTARVDNFTITAVPEPSSSMLMMLGVVGLAGIRAFGRKQS